MLKCLTHNGLNICTQSCTQYHSKYMGRKEKKLPFVCTQSIHFLYMHRENTQAGMKLLLIVICQDFVLHCNTEINMVGLSI